MARERVAGAAHGRAQPVLPPARARRRGADVGHRRVDRGVEQLVLAAEVAVEGHRPDVERGREPAHAQPLEAVRVEEGERGLRQLFPREARAWRRRTRFRFRRRSHAGSYRTAYGTAYGECSPGAREV